VAHSSILRSRTLSTVERIARLLSEQQGRDVHTVLAI
jgi:hypothetical protein